jgi:HEAT repeat protein
LIKLLSSPDEHTRFQAAKSLEEIDPGNKEAISALIKLLSSPDEYLRGDATESLGQIAKGNKEAIFELINLLQFSTDDSIRKQAAETLEKILQKEQMLGVVTALKDYLSDETYQNNFDQFNYCYKILWKCAQTLSYPDFYQAWHSE